MGLLNCNEMTEGTCTSCQKLTTPLPTIHLDENRPNWLVGANAPEQGLHMASQSTLLCRSTNVTGVVRQEDPGQRVELAGPCGTC